MVDHGQPWLTKVSHGRPCVEGGEQPGSPVTSDSCDSLEQGTKLGTKVTWFWGEEDRRKKECPMHV